MLTSTSQQSKQLRNDVLMVVSLVASNCSNSPFVVSNKLHIGNNYRYINIGNWISKRLM